VYIYITIYIYKIHTQTHTHTLDKNGLLYDPAGTESWNMQIRDETTKLTRMETNRHAGSWLSRLPWTKMKIVAGTQIGAQSVLQIKWVSLLVAVPNGQPHTQIRNQPKTKRKTDNQPKQPNKTEGKKSGRGIKSPVRRRHARGRLSTRSWVTNPYWTRGTQCNWQDIDTMAK
jgi:hypothetical protein